MRRGREEKKRRTGAGEVVVGRDDTAGEGKVAHEGGTPLVAGKEGEVAVGLGAAVETERRDDDVFAQIAERDTAEIVVEDLLAVVVGIGAVHGVEAAEGGGVEDDGDVVAVYLQALGRAVAVSKQQSHQSSGGGAGNEVHIVQESGELEHQSVKHSEGEHALNRGEREEENHMAIIIIIITIIIIIITITIP